jgi:hypothetical protein
MARDVLCAHSAQTDTTQALAELGRELASIDPVVILFFSSANHDGPRLQSELQKLAPKAEVVGCTTGGEFTADAYTQGGVALLALSSAKVKRCAAAMAEYDKGDSVEVAVHAATTRIADKLSVDLRELDPKDWVGVVLNEGLKGNEEEVNEVLGHVAPFLSFLGGSAGDNIKLVETRVFYDGRQSVNGSVFLLMELAVPHVIIKTCSFEPTARKVKIGRVQGRVCYELDGKPSVTTYAEMVGVTPEQLNPMVFMQHPLGVMIEGEPWVRSPIAVTPDGGLVFGCKVLEGSELNLLKATDLVGDTKNALAEGAKTLGATPSVGVLFNCAHRYMEVNARQLEAPFREAISPFPVAGFHSYGESWLAHMNQTLIGLLLG